MAMKSWKLEQFRIRDCRAVYYPTGESGPPPAAMEWADWLACGTTCPLDVVATTQLEVQSMTWLEVASKSQLDLW